MHDIQGKTVRLRLAESDDAAYIHSLRVNSALNEHLSAVTGDVEAQRAWLLSYKSREKAAQEYYFIIERSDTGQAIGTVRLYDFIGNKESFCWGSWILDENKTRYAAIESAMLVYEFAFKELGFKSCHFDVRKENIKVIAFHEKMGAQRLRESELDFFFSMNPESYNNFFNAKSKYLMGES
ncbi:MULTISPECIES: GNAT family N-acetyltransferase [Pseudomonas]|uniref:GNAT family N-acetyltransferase n=4 Tax=Pseudomonas lactis TaxID=1615674 RepID=A0A7Y1LDB5_9PSED|nr:MULTISPECIES: GNAT family N-acetyltransferase [Pseudomonas]MBI6978325.1 GNAT family N-acetyltransferase [Pseudomonas lactis]MCF4975310.1 GNAT family N-acetyltransferase [Pseudomonas lactis]MCF5003342.1 GNAT family N-acetyltransferase [Pseudomonas lactis]MCF5007093.1 GNAT family N-acetyltransferase [Pseudomonas lactis]MCF5013927.1 GNAT family N-acetyltransferase [Pseudomonas lactis]